MEAHMGMVLERSWLLLQLECLVGAAYLQLLCTCRSCFYTNGNPDARLALLKPYQE